MFSGATTPLARASRSSATDLPENSVSPPVARLAAFCAFCCRARAWPPFLAAARRFDCPPDRAVEDFARELLDDFAREVEDFELDDFAREVEDLERELEDFARLPPERPDPLRDPDERRDPPPELLESAMSSPPLRQLQGVRGTIPLRTRR
jgi:hypothetical protein